MDSDAHVRRENAALVAVLAMIALILLGLALWPIWAGADADNRSAADPAPSMPWRSHPPIEVHR